MKHVNVSKVIVTLIGKKPELDIKICLRRIKVVIMLVVTFVAIVLYTDAMMGLQCLRAKTQHH